MDIEAIVKKYSEDAPECSYDFDRSAAEVMLRAALTELSETHAIELRAYEATVANQAERIRQLEAELERLWKDAERWQKLRAMDWFDSPFCVVRDPKGRISPGSDCPSGTRLDSFIDATEIRIERWPDPSRVREILEKKK